MAPVGGSESGSQTVALDDRGNAIAMWSNNSGTYASFRPVAAAAWRAPVELDAARGGGLHVGFDRAGNALAAWSELDGSGSWRARAASRPVGRSWGKPDTIASRAYLEDLEVDREGDALALLTSYPSGGLTTLQRLVAGSGWRPAGDVASGSGHAALAADDAGNAVVMWDQFESGRDALKAAIHPARSTSWRPSLDLPNQSVVDSVHIDMDMAGNALAVWSEGGWVVAGDELRARGPLLEKVSVPPAGRAGVAVQFQVRAVPWGAPLRGAPRWNFGDGQSGRGTRVSHVYSRRGRYTVRVSQADAARGTTVAAATITITRASG